MHRDNPAFSAAEARIQWYGELSRPGTSLAAVDGHDDCSALPCSLHSTQLAVAAFIAVGTTSFSFAHSTGSSLGMLR